MTTKTIRLEDYEIDLLRELLDEYADRKHSSPANDNSSTAIEILLKLNGTWEDHAADFGLPAYSD